MIVIVNFAPVSCPDETKAVLVPTAPLSTFTARYLITNLPLTARFALMYAGHVIEEVEYVQWNSAHLCGRFALPMTPGNQLAILFSHCFPCTAHAYLIGDTDGYYASEDGPVLLPDQEKYRLPMGPIEGLPEGWGRR